MITLTDAAADKIKTLVYGEDATALRLSVRGGGCSGFQYAFSFADEIDDADFVAEHDGAKLVVDPISFTYLDGSELDFVTKVEGEFFAVNNPNIQNKCGCGSSFQA